MLRYDGKCVVVTGAGRGLGREYALLLASRGAQVVVNDIGFGSGDVTRADSPATDVVAEIRGVGGVAAADFSDVADPVDAQRLVDNAIKTFGRVDALINNAGTFPQILPFWEKSTTSFKEQWRVHVEGSLNMCRAVLPHMRERGRGRIVNTCSVQGTYGGPGTADYAAAKGAVQALTFSLAEELREIGILVVGISPGGFTRMVASYEELQPEMTNVLASHLKPSLVAPLAAWLCHESCQESGALFEAMAGRFSRVISAEPTGYWDSAPTIESVALGLRKMDMFELPVRPRHANDIVMATVQEAIARSSLR